MFRIQILILCFAFPSLLIAEQISFSDLWVLIRENSSIQKSKNLEWKASEIVKDRTAKHWLPRFYTDVRTYNTNDPTLNFMGKLGQRSVTESDFSTNSIKTRPGNYLDSNNQPYTNINSDTLNAFGKDSLNYPGFNTYTKGSMGVDIPLYEGGSGRTLSRIQEKKSNALFWEKEAQKERDYIQSAFFYRGVESLNEFIRRTEDIKKIETRFRSNYQFANKSNPVGYSGYLALKGLDNRLSILITQTNTQSEQFKNNLAVLSGINSEDLRLVNEDLQSFLNRYFPLAPTDESSLAKAMSSYVEGETFKSDLEASKFLPRIGFYSEANTYNGSRNTQTAYNAGVYLQMNLYNPKDIGVIEEAKLNAEAFQKKLEEVRRQEDLSIRNLRNQEITLNENYLLLKESLKLQEEQTSNMLRLFQTGVISAIQFTESLNRTTDISKSLLDVELELIRVRTEKYLFQKKEYVDVAN